MSESQNTSTSSPGQFAQFAKLGFVALNLIVTLGGAYLVYAGTLGYKPKVMFEREIAALQSDLRSQLQSDPVIYTMETFNTNLEGLPRKFVRLEVSVEMYSKEGFEELIRYDGPARDALMKILNSKKIEEIESVQGKLRLKNEMAMELNDLLHHGVVKNIYFTKFQVQ